MNARKEAAKNMKSQPPPTVRATISFPSKIYATLEGIAKQKKVSLAWVVREAAEKYVAEQWPLSSKGEGSGKRE